MVVVPLAASENQSARKPESNSMSDSRFWVRAAAAGSLAAGGVLLMTGQRRAGLVAAAAGTALTAFDQSETVRSWWSQFPGYLDEVPEPGQQAFENKWGVSVGGYAVGAESEIAPKNVGTFIPPGGAIGFQTHYTPFGKEVTDHTQIALYFYKDNEKPDLVMHNSVIVNNAIVIPPNDPHHQEVGYLTFPKDALLYSAFPHAHYRGAMSDLWIRYPDGKEKELLSLPRYDFSWQRDYTFAEPIKVPAGSKLIAHFIYDNSKRNPNNPDPSKQVVWGDQSWEEMFYMAIRYRWVDETSKHMVNYDQDLNRDRLMGMLDSNIDGKISKAELKGQIGEQIAKYWDVLDKNHDGYIDSEELAAMQKMSGQHRRREAATDGKPAAPAAAPAAAPSAGK